jgi:hypothetical protein
MHAYVHQTQSAWSDRRQVQGMYALDQVPPDGTVPIAAVYIVLG